MLAREGRGERDQCDEVEFSVEFRIRFLKIGKIREGKLKVSPNFLLFYSCPVCDKQKDPFHGIEDPKGRGFHSIAFASSPRPSSPTCE